MLEVIALLLAIPVAVLTLAFAAYVATAAKAKTAETEMENAIRAQMLINAVSSAERMAKAEALAEAALAEHDLLRYYAIDPDEKTH